MIKGFVKMNNEIVRNIISDCKSSSVAMTYLMILSHKNKSPDSCFPSYNTLMNELNISKNTLMSHLKQLVDNEYLAIDSGSKSCANKYYFPREDYMYTKNDYERYVISNVGKNIDERRKHKCVY